MEPVSFRVLSKWLSIFWVSMSIMNSITFCVDQELKIIFFQGETDVKSEPLSPYV